MILQEYNGTVIFCCLDNTEILFLSIYRAYWLPKPELALELDNKYSEMHLQTNQINIL